MSDRLALRASYEERSADDCLKGSEDVLAVFEFGRSPLASSDPRHVPVALAQLDSPPRCEVWRGDGPIKTGTWDGLRFSQGVSLTMGHIALDLREAGDMRESSRRAYDLLQSYLQQSPHQWPLKIWNYIPGINEGSGDEELYRQFCLGRAEAVLFDPADRPPLPAATGIGTPPDEPALQVYFLAAALPGLDVENPRQVSAWRYPRRYGPKSPLFSRATIMRMNGGSQFLISGTASILGHQTHHENQVANQLSESLRNVHSLLDEGHRLMGDSLARLDGEGLLKVYIRQPEDYALIRRTLEAEAPDEIPRIYLQGDICRENLLTEIDGIVSCHRVAS
ncbi:MAG: pteridine-dependent deoxygenase [Xanthomonadales bacterium]|nr:pteridine-dependent deoxygenase [Xanthomonadales bacterium]